MSNYGNQFMKCTNCGSIAESESVDVGVGLYIKGDYACHNCDWEIYGPLDYGFVGMEDRKFAPGDAD